MTSRHHLVFALALALPSVGCIQAARAPATPDSDAAGADTATGDADDGADTADTGPSCDAGTCAIGLACLATGTERPGHPCQVCDPVSHAGGWSNRDEALACDDGDPCSPSSSCVSGECVGAVDPICAHPPACVDHVDCDASGCVPTLTGNTCLIAGECWSSGTPRPEHPCQRCAPATEPLGWTALASGACDDGDACTDDDACVAGTCQGVARDCDDQLSCTIDSCQDGQCRHALASGACLIAGGCHNGGEVSQGDACLACDPAHPDGWSARNGVACDDQDACTGPDTCDAVALCAGPLVTLDAQPNDVDPEQLGGSPLAIGAGYPSGTAVGNLNPAASDVDWYTYAMLMYSADVRRKPKVGLRGLDAGASYEVCVWARCGVNELDAVSPSVSCSGGPTATLTGHFSGCCASLTGVQEAALVLDARCSTSVVGASIGVVRVRLRQGTTSGGTGCPGYSLDWGAITN